MKKLLLAICLPLLTGAFLVASSPAPAQAFNPFEGSVCNQTDDEGNVSPVCETDGSNPVTGETGVINRIANIFALITGVAAVVAIILGGFEYVRSGGDSAKVNKAKNTILFAIIGLVIVVVARTLVLFVAQKV